MKWKQFLTPVGSISSDAAQKLAAEKGQGELLFLDVRQPKEYQRGHLPSAKLIPLGELDKRLDELDHKQPTVVYCAIGGRSRVAAQMLAGNGFAKVYNLSGGIKAWENVTAVGPEDQGMELFTGKESVKDSIIVAYGLEEGLRDFYLDLCQKTTDKEAREVFTKLAEIEVLHQERLLSLYQDITGDKIDGASFSASTVAPALEGGMTTEEYLMRFHPDMESVTDIISLAMSIEAQALDLYQRAANRTKDIQSKEILQTIANEERAHLQYLATLMDQKVA